MPTMGLLDRAKRRVSDANAKAKADMGKVRDDFRAGTAEHRAAWDQARGKDTEADQPHE